MQELFFYIDDSGVLHKYANDFYFVYAGYVFTSKEEKDEARRKYKNLSKKIAHSINCNGELKACNVSNPTHKRALYNVMKKYHSFDVCVSIKKIKKEELITNKNSIVRYKDYVLKRAIKDVVVRLIKKNLIDSCKDITINIFIDEQLTCSNGFYQLQESIYEELSMGISNFNYGITFKPVLFGNCSVKVQYCDSKYEYLVQASDFLANRIFNSYRKNDEKLYPSEKICKLNNHTGLILP